MPRTLRFFSLALWTLSGAGVLAQPAVEGTQPAATSPPRKVEDVDEKDNEDYYELLMAFADTLDQIERNYVDKVDRRELLQAAIEGVLKKLDPYSNYIPPDNLDQFKVEVENEFGGIGIQISGEANQLRVISPLVGTPAYRAGVLAGDLILAIDGTSTKGMTLSDAIKRMKGRAGTSLTLTVFHPYESKTEDIELTREVVKVETILGDRRQKDDTWQFMYDTQAKIGYVRVSALSRDTGSDLRAVVKTLREEGLRGLILDLRFNPGGLLKAAIEVSDMFLSSGTIVSTAGRNIHSQVWEATSENTFAELPLVVLVNQFSASASEIVAAALQDHQRAVVVGQQTFGKASVQNVIELEEGRSALKLTTGSYQRPSGKPIHRFPDAEEWGVRPNDGFEVEHRQIGAYMLQRRQRDVVSNHKSDDESEETQPELDDPQLIRALEYLREKLTEKTDISTP